MTPYRVFFGLSLFFALLMIPIVVYDFSVGHCYWGVGSIAAGLWNAFSAYKLRNAM